MPETAFEKFDDHWLSPECCAGKSRFAAFDGTGGC
jgi:rubredoxin